MANRNRVFAWHVASDMDEILQSARELSFEETAMVTGGDAIIVNSSDGCSTMTLLGGTNEGPRQWDEMDG